MAPRVLDHDDVAGLDDRDARSETLRTTGRERRWLLRAGLAARRSKRRARCAIEPPAQIDQLRLGPRRVHVVGDLRPVNERDSVQPARQQLGRELRGARARERRMDDRVSGERCERRALDVAQRSIAAHEIELVRNERSEPAPCLLHARGEARHHHALADHPQKEAAEVARAPLDHAAFVLDRRAERQHRLGRLRRREAGEELAMESVAGEHRAMLPRAARATYAS